MTVFFFWYVHPFANCFDGRSTDVSFQAKDAKTLPDGPGPISQSELVML